LKINVNFYGNFAKIQFGNILVRRSASGIVSRDPINFALKSPEGSTNRFMINQLAVTQPNNGSDPRAAGSLEMKPGWKISPGRAVLSICSGN